MRNKLLFSITLSYIGGFIISLIWDLNDWQSWIAIIVWAAFITLINPYKDE